MRAMQLHQPGPTLVLAEVPRPTPGPGEVLIRVHAAGVTTTELDWYPTTHLKDGAERINAIPTHEFSGVVVATGGALNNIEAVNNVDSVASVNVGDLVYGMNDWFADGALAELCLTQPLSIAPKPATLTHAEAATLPIGALTAWQGLIDRAKVQPQERVLVHGGTGGVGIFAVQLAHLHGAHVIATASAQHASLLRQLGADEVIDYKTGRFETQLRDIDIVFDTVGGDTRERSWSVLKPNGRMISIAADGETSTDPRIKNNYFIVELNRAQLIEVAKLIDAGRLKTFVNAEVPLEDAAAAYAKSLPKKHGYGKVVVTIA